MMDSMEKSMLGLTDKPAKKDIFGIEKYIDGLSNFLSSCNMPMTISIQGDWGTGKTSIMEQVSDRLNSRQECKCIWFNTWQQSQFNMSDELATSLLTGLVDELEDKEQSESGKFIKTFAGALKAGGKLLKDIGLAYIDHKIGERAANYTEEFLMSFGNKEPNLVEGIKKVKDKFHNCVKKSLEKENRSRAVIFVDDLDRLQPGKAVEVLEVLKLFLDCERCVFVLAIDYSVVSKGIVEKYGALLEEEKGKSFFEKIIQVPFKVPVAEYNITNYVKECFDQLGLKINEGEAPVYVGLIQSSLGANPRGMKRLFNAYLLLTMVVTPEILETDRNKQMLFAVLCLQQSYEKIYDYIIRNRDIITKETLSIFANNESEAYRDLMDEIGYDEDQSDKLNTFMKILIHIADTSGDNRISDTEMEAFRNILGVSTITSAAGVMEKPRTVRIGESVYDIINETHTDPEVVDVYNALDEKIRSLDSTITRKFTLGQKAVVYFTGTESGGSRRFCEIGFKKSSITPYILMGKNGVTTEILERVRKIRTTNTEITNQIGKGALYLNGIRNSDDIDEIMALIKDTYLDFKSK